MPRLLGFHERDPETARLVRAGVAGHRQGAEVRLIRINPPAIENAKGADLLVSLTSSSGAQTHDLLLTTRGARALRDYLIEFCDDMADHPEAP